MRESGKEQAGRQRLGARGSNWGSSFLLVASRAVHLLWRSCRQQLGRKGERCNKFWLCPRHMGHMACGLPMLGPPLAGRCCSRSMPGQWWPS